MSQWLSRVPLAWREKASSYWQELQATWETRDLSLLPPNCSMWDFLVWLRGQNDLADGGEGWVFLPARRSDVLEFLPETPIQEYAPDFMDDEDYPALALLATSDPLWAMGNALLGHSRVTGVVSRALYCRAGLGWDGPRYYFSVSSDADIPDGRALLSAGFVYVLPGQGFQPLPFVEQGNRHQVGGNFREPLWVKERGVRPLWCLPVQPQDFPFPAHLHDAARVKVRRDVDPAGFPWLPSGERLTGWGK